jgi:hypothetical protein
MGDWDGKLFDVPKMARNAAAVTAAISFASITSARRSPAATTSIFSYK